jgi:hypothetical protein
MCILGVMACGSDEPPVTTDPTTTTDTAEPTNTTTATVTTEDTGPNAWQVDGQQGNLVSVYRGFAPGLPRGFDVFATFAEAMPTGQDVAWCLGGGPCIDAPPSEPDTYIDVGPVPELADVSWTWVGNGLRVDGQRVPFENNPEDAFAWYTHTVAKKPDVSLVEVQFEENGEWGAYEGAVLPQAPSVRVTDPTPGERVNLSADELSFAWEAGGEGEVYLTIQGERAADDPISVYYLLEDDGAFNLSLSEHGLTPESDVRIAIGRRVVDEVDVNGNTLQVTGLDEQSYRPECLPYPDVTVPTSAPASGTMQDPFYMDISAYGIFAQDGIHDYTEDGADAPTSARIVFTFLDFYAQPVCKVTYDISGERAVAPKKPWSVYGAFSGYGPSVWMAYDLTLADGRSNCDGVNAALWGSTDLRNWLELFTWGIGVGDNVDVAGQMTYAGYVSFDGVSGIELDEVSAYELLDCDRAIKGAGRRPYDGSSGVFEDAYLEFEPYYILIIQ